MSDNITVSVDFVTPKTSKLDSSIQSVLHTDYHFHAKSNKWEKMQYYSSKNDIHQRHTEYIKTKSCSIDFKPGRCMSLQYLYKIIKNIFLTCMVYH